ncbi:MAG: DUF5343 domain-containing protein [Acidobacteriia bacterium]|nr:DUF5343 domain-containing protein [Terriglobia bacterium]
MSGTGAITGAINQFRKTLPSAVTAETLKKLGLAPNNESYVINILRFVGVIDKDGNSTTEGTAVFSKHGNDEFHKGFEKLMRDSYAELFKLYGDETWTADDDALISFFRGSDKTSDLVGRRQASTFRVLASFAGHGEPPSAKAAAGLKTASSKTRSVAPKVSKTAPNQRLAQGQSNGTASGGGRDVGLTVRIEVNLPAAGDQETYDRIFRSIRENLLNGK